MGLGSFLGLTGRRLQEQGFTRSRADRHMNIDLVGMRKRRAKNKVARRSRRLNRIACVR